MSLSTDAPLASRINALQIINLDNAKLQRQQNQNTVLKILQQCYAITKVNSSNSNLPVSNAPKLAKVIEMGLVVVFQLIQDSYENNSQLCIKSLSALLDILQSLQIEELKLESNDVLNSLCNLLSSLSNTYFNSNPQSNELCTIQGSSKSSSQMIPSLSSTCLISLLLARGKTDALFNAITQIIMSSHQQASREIKLPNIVLKLQQSVNKIVTKSLPCRPSWFQSGVELSSCSLHFCVSMENTEPSMLNLSMSELEERDTERSHLTSDGQFLYIFTQFGILLKIGSGFKGTVKGHIYSSSAEYQQHKNTWIGFAKGNLFFHSSLTTPTFHIINTETLQMDSHKGFLLEGEDTPPEFVLFTDSEHLGLLMRKEASNGIKLRLYSPVCSPMPLLQEVDLHLNRRSVVRLVLTQNKERSLPPKDYLGLGINPLDVLNVSIAQQFSLLLTKQGKVYWQGRDGALGLGRQGDMYSEAGGSGAPATGFQMPGEDYDGMDLEEYPPLLDCEEAGKTVCLEEESANNGRHALNQWRELALPLSQPIICISAGHEGRHAVLVTETGLCLFVGEASRGNDGGSLKQQPGADPEITRVRLFGNGHAKQLIGRQIVSCACNQGSTALITREGRLILLGKDAIHLPPDGTPSVLQRHHIAQVALGKAHGACVTATGYLLVFGVNNRCQCGVPLPSKSTAPTATPVVPPDVMETADLSSNIASADEEDAIGTNRDHSYEAEYHIPATSNFGTSRSHFSNQLAVFPQKLNLDGHRIQQVACGLYHTVCLTKNGLVYSFGSNTYGQLGRGKTSSRELPGVIPIPELTLQVTCGSYTTACLTETGRVFVFGRNTSQGPLPNIGGLSGRQRALYVRAGTDTIVLGLDEDLARSDDVMAASRSRGKGLIEVTASCDALILMSSAGNLTVERISGKARLWSQSHDQLVIDPYRSGVTIDPTFNNLWVYSTIPGDDPTSNGTTWMHSISCYSLGSAPPADNLSPIALTSTELNTPDLALPIKPGSSVVASQVALYILGSLDNLLSSKSSGEANHLKESSNMNSTESKSLLLSRLTSFNRFRKVVPARKSCLRYHLAFSCDRSIDFYGFFVYGYPELHTVACVMLKYCPPPVSNEAQQKEVTEPPSSEELLLLMRRAPLQNLPFNFHRSGMACLLLQDCLTLEKNVVYLIDIEMDGPSVGMMGEESFSQLINQDGATFQFYENDGFLSQTRSQFAESCQGQIPGFLYRVCGKPVDTSLDASNRMENKESTRTDPVSPGYFMLTPPWFTANDSAAVNVISDQFVTQITPECLDSLLNLLNWAWTTLTYIVSEVGDHSGACMEATLCDMKRYVFIATVSMRIIRRYLLMLYPLTDMSGVKESSQFAEVTGDIRVLVRNILQDSKLCGYLYQLYKSSSLDENEEDYSNLTNNFESNTILPCVVLYGNVLNEAYVTMIQCFYIFYPTDRHKFTCLTQTLHNLHNQQSTSYHWGLVRFASAIIESVTNSPFSLLRLLPFSLFTRLCHTQSRSRHPSRVCKSTDPESNSTPKLDARRDTACLDAGDLVGPSCGDIMVMKYPFLVSHMQCKIEGEHQSSQLDTLKQIVDCLLQLMINDSSVEWSPLLINQSYSTRTKFSCRELDSVNMRWSRHLQSQVSQFLVSLLTDLQFNMKQENMNRHSASSSSQRRPKPDSQQSGPSMMSLLDPGLDLLMTRKASSGKAFLNYPPCDPGAPTSTTPASTMLTTRVRYPVVSRTDHTCSVLCTDVLCFSVEKVSVTLLGCRVYVPESPDVEPVLSLYENIERGPFEKWRKLKVSAKCGSMSRDRTTIKIMLKQSVKLKPHQRYAIEIVFQKSKPVTSTIGRSGGNLIKGPDGTIFSLWECNLRSDFSHFSEGHIPSLLYTTSDLGGQTPSVGNSLSSRYRHYKTALLLIITEMRKHATRILNRISSIRDGIRRSSIFANVFFRECLPRCISLMSSEASANPKMSIFFLAFVQDLLPALVSNLNPQCHPVSDCNIAEPLSRGVSTETESVKDDHPGEQEREEEEFTVVVESEHPYRSSSVTRYRVTFPDTVVWMKLEFDPRCRTCQREDHLTVLIPSSQNHSEPNNRRKKVIVSVESLVDHFNPLLDNPKNSFKKQKESSKTKPSESETDEKYSVVLENLSSQPDSWPQFGGVLVPGNELIFVFESASIQDMANQSGKVNLKSNFGFSCDVTGYVTPDEKQALQNLESALCQLGGTCIESLFTSATRNPLDTLAESSEAALDIFKNYQKFFSNGFTLSRIPTLKEALEDNLSAPADTNLTVFIRDFLQSNPQSLINGTADTFPGSRLALWLQSRPYVEPGNCQVMINCPQSSCSSMAENRLYCTMPAMMWLQLRDQFNRPVICSQARIVAQIIPECNLTNLPDKKLGDEKMFGGCPVPDTSVPYETTRRDKKEIFHAISIMKHYENYSFEELRVCSKPADIRCSEHLRIVPSEYEGRYYLEWTPSQSGWYKLRVMVDDCPVQENTASLGTPCTPTSALSSTSCTHNPYAATIHVINPPITRPALPSLGAAYRSSPANNNEAAGASGPHLSELLMEHMGDVSTAGRDSHRMNQYRGRTSLSINGNHEVDRIFYFPGRQSAGLRIRCQPSLQSPSFGNISPGGIIEITEELHNEDGVWLRLSAACLFYWSLGATMGGMSQQHMLSTAGSTAAALLLLERRGSMPRGAAASSSDECLTSLCEEGWCLQDNLHTGKSLVRELKHASIVNNSVTLPQSSEYDTGAESLPRRASQMLSTQNGTNSLANGMPPTESKSANPSPLLSRRRPHLPHCYEVTRYAPFGVAIHPIPDQSSLPIGYLHCRERIEVLSKFEETMAGRWVGLEIRKDGDKIAPGWLLASSIQGVHFLKPVLDKSRVAEPCKLPAETDHFPSPPPPFLPRNNRHPSSPSNSRGAGRGHVHPGLASPARSLVSSSPNHQSSSAVRSPDLDSNRKMPPPPPPSANTVTAGTRTFPNPGGSFISSHVGNVSPRSAKKIPVASPVSSPRQRRVGSRTHDYQPNISNFSSLPGSSVLPQSPAGSPKSPHQSQLSSSGAYKKSSQCPAAHKSSLPTSASNHSINGSPGKQVHHVKFQNAVTPTIAAAQRTIFLALLYHRGLLPEVIAMTSTWLQQQTHQCSMAGSLKFPPTNRVALSRVQIIQQAMSNMEHQLQQQSNHKGHSIRRSQSDHTRLEDVPEGAAPCCSTAQQAANGNDTAQHCLLIELIRPYIDHTGGGRSHSSSSGEQDATPDSSKVDEPGSSCRGLSQLLNLWNYLQTLLDLCCSLYYTKLRQLSANQRSDTTDHSTNSNLAPPKTKRRSSSTSKKPKQCPDAEHVATDDMKSNSVHLTQKEKIEYRRQTSTKDSNRASFSSLIESSFCVGVPASFTNAFYRVILQNSCFLLELEAENHLESSSTLLSCQPKTAAPPTTGAPPAMSTSQQSHSTSSLTSSLACSTFLHLTGAAHPRLFSGATVTCPSLPDCAEETDHTADEFQMMSITPSQYLARLLKTQSKRDVPVLDSFFPNSNVLPAELVHPDRHAATRQASYSDNDEAPHTSSARPSVGQVVSRLRHTTSLGSDKQGSGLAGAAGNNNGGVAACRSQLVAGLSSLPAGRGAMLQRSLSELGTVESLIQGASPILNRHSISSSVRAGNGHSSISSAGAQTPSAATVALSNTINDVMTALLTVLCTSEQAHTAGGANQNLDIDTQSAASMFDLSALREVNLSLSNVKHLDEIKMAMKMSVKNAAIKYSAFHTLIWILRSLTQTSSLHTLLWSYYNSALLQPLNNNLSDDQAATPSTPHDFPSLNVQQRSTNQNIASSIHFKPVGNQLSALLVKHPLSGMELCGDQVYRALQESLWIYMVSVADLMPHLNHSTEELNTLKLALRLWSLPFNSTDQIYLHRSQVFTHLSRMLQDSAPPNLDSCTETAAEEGEDGRSDFHSYLRQVVQMEKTRDISGELDILKPAFKQELEPLFDNDTTTFWETHHPNPSLVFKLPEHSVANRSISTQWQTSDSPLFLSVYIDNHRDCQRAFTKTVSLYVRAKQRTLLEKIDLTEEHVGWVSIQFSAHKFNSSELIYTLQFNSGGATNKVRIRGLILLAGGSSTEWPVTRSRDLLLHACQEEALSVFKLISAQVFSKLIGSEAAPCPDDFSTPSDLQEQMVGILFGTRSTSFKMSHLQRQILAHIVKQIRAQNLKLKSYWLEKMSAWMNAKNRGLLLDEAVRPPDPMSDEAANSSMSDAYCFELLSQVLALSGSAMGKSFLCQQEDMISDIFDLLHVGSARIKRQVLALINRILSEISPKRLSSILHVDLPPSSLSKHSTNDKQAENSPMKTKCLPTNEKFRARVLDCMFGLVASAITIQVKVKREHTAVLPQCRKKLLSIAQIMSQLRELPGLSTHQELSKVWPLVRIDLKMAAAILKVLVDILNGQISGSWQDTLRWSILNNINTLNKIDISQRNLNHLANNLQFYLTLATFAAVTNAFIDWIPWAAIARDNEPISDAQIDSPTGAASGTVLCANHDDGVTTAAILCELCDHLCIECDRVLHLSRRSKTHQRHLLPDRETNSEFSLDIHEGCVRVKLSWMTIRLDTVSLKCLIEINESADYVPGVMTSPSAAGDTAIKSTETELCCQFCGQRRKSEEEEDEEVLPAICTNLICQQTHKLLCDKSLPCGHHCNSVKGEVECLPCLKCLSPEMAMKRNLKQDKEDLCMICFTDSLVEAPVLQLMCGHLLHFHCVRMQLIARWPAVHITFGFTLCPICKTKINHSALEDLLQPIKDLEADVRRKGLMRLQFENLLDSPEVTTPGSRFYQDPEAFALERYAYYVCYKCKKPYYGGEIRCDQAARHHEVQFNPQELVCGACSDVTRSQICPRHSTDFLDYKCRYCCSVAVFFCFGSTHFCEICHDNLAIMNSLQNDLPKCPAGPGGVQLEGDCPLQVEHPPTGEEFALGCGLCRNTQLF